MIQWKFKGKDLVSTDGRFHITEHREGASVYIMVRDAETDQYYPRPALEDPTLFCEELLRQEIGVMAAPLRWSTTPLGRLMSQDGGFLIKGPFNAGVSVRFVLLMRNGSPGFAKKAHRFLCLTEQDAIELANALRAGKGVLGR